MPVWLCLLSLCLFAICLHAHRLLGNMSWHANRFVVARDDFKHFFGDRVSMEWLMLLVCWVDLRCVLIYGFIGVLMSDHLV